MGGPDVHPLAIAYEVEEEIVEELEEELATLAQKTRAALKDSYAEVDELRKQNVDSLEVRAYIYIYIYIFHAPCCMLCSYTTRA